MTKKPDQVVDNPGIMPYTTNVGAPAIQKEDVELWKQQSVGKVNHQFKTRFEELKKQYQQLVDEYNWNDLVYNSKYSFEPIIGEVYYLYYNAKEELFGFGCMYSVPVSVISNKSDIPFSSAAIA